MIDSMQGYMQAHAPLPLPHGHNIRHTGGREFNMCSCASSNSSGPSCLFKRCTSCVLKPTWHTGSVARASLSCASAQETDLQHCSIKLAGACSRHSAQNKDHTVPRLQACQKCRGPSTLSVVLGPVCDCRRRVVMVPASSVRMCTGDFPDTAHATALG